MAASPIRLTLQGHTEKVAPEALRMQISPQLGHDKLLYHQWRTWDALRRYPMVMNIYNTGTGKTRASLLHLLDMDAQFRATGQASNVLFIAPTNALLAQHVQDINDFVQQHELRFRVIELNADEVRNLRANAQRPIRNGEILQRLVNNHQLFRSDKDDKTRKAAVFVVNPDILYYAMYFYYNGHDRYNVAEAFISRFDYIVVDEFHYYNAKQFANFLFMFGLFKQFGYFEPSGPGVDDRRRICLLSATPRPDVMAKLHNLLPDQVALIAPDNEPPESDAYETVATLAPLHVTLASETLTQWLAKPDCPLIRWVRDEAKDGVLISSSLARINDAWFSLRQQAHGYFDDSVMGRITGPESVQTRAYAALLRLILATPTVDIGYNFGKANKPDRQNIDFVVCDARFRDEAIQRMGRAGRVLNKQHSDIPAEAVILIDDALLPHLADLDGQTLTRADFNARLESLDDFPAKNGITDYLRWFALQELAYPVLELEKHMAEEADRQTTSAIYDLLAAIIAPDQAGTLKCYRGYYRKLSHREQWLTAYHKDDHCPPPNTGEMARDVALSVGRKDETVETDANQLGSLLQKHEHWVNKRALLVEFVESQTQLSKSLFTFRGSQETFTALFHDPDHLFSAEDWNEYDILHILRNYELRDHWLLTPQAFAKQVNIPTEQLTDAAFYLARLIRRDVPLGVCFQLTPPFDQMTFETMCIGKVVALCGFAPQLIDTERNIVTGGVPTLITDCFEQSRLVCLLVPKQAGGAVNALSRAGLIASTVTVKYQDTGKEQQMPAYFGLPAFEAYAALQRTLAWIKYKQGRLNDDPIIC